MYNEIWKGSAIPNAKKIFYTLLGTGIVRNCFPYQPTYTVTIERNYWLRLVVARSTILHFTNRTVQFK